jgi:hypothetical protein
MKELGTVLDKGIVAGQYAVFVLFSLAMRVPGGDPGRTICVSYYLRYKESVNGQSNATALCSGCAQLRRDCAEMASSA